MQSPYGFAFCRTRPQRQWGNVRVVGLRHSHPIKSSKVNWIIAQQWLLSLWLGPNSKHLASTAGSCINAPPYYFMESVVRISMVQLAKLLCMTIACPWPGHWNARSPVAMSGWVGLGILFSNNVGRPLARRFLFREPTVHTTWTHIATVKQLVS